MPPLLRPADAAAAERLVGEFQCGGGAGESDALRRAALLARSGAAGVAAQRAEARWRSAAAAAAAAEAAASSAGGEGEVSRVARACALPGLRAAAAACAEQLACSTARVASLRAAVEGDMCSALNRDTVVLQPPTAQRPAPPPPSPPPSLPPPPPPPFGVDTLRARRGVSPLPPPLTSAPRPPAAAPPPPLVLLPHSPPSSHAPMASHCPSPTSPTSPKSPTLFSKPPHPRFEQPPPRSARWSRSGSPHRSPPPPPHQTQNAQNGGVPRSPPVPLTSPPPLLPRPGAATRDAPHPPPCASNGHGGAWWQDEGGDGGGGGGGGGDGGGGGGGGRGGTEWDHGIFAPRVRHDGGDADVNEPPARAAEATREGDAPAAEAAAVLSRRPTAASKRALFDAVGEVKRAQAAAAAAAMGGGGDAAARGSSGAAAAPPSHRASAPASPAAAPGRAQGGGCGAAPELATMSAERVYIRLGGSGGGGRSGGGASGPSHEELGAFFATAFSSSSHSVGMQGGGVTLVGGTVPISSDGAPPFLRLDGGLRRSGSDAFVARPPLRSDAPHRNSDSSASVKGAAWSGGAGGRGGGGGGDGDAASPAPDLGGARRNSVPDKSPPAPRPLLEGAAVGHGVLLPLRPRHARHSLPRGVG